MKLLWILCADLGGLFSGRCWPIFDDSIEESQFSSETFFSLLVDFAQFLMTVSRKWGFSIDTSFGSFFRFSSIFDDSIEEMAV